jgi:hypothetical protein
VVYFKKTSGLKINESKALRILHLLVEKQAEQLKNSSLTKFYQK